MTLTTTKYQPKHHIRIVTAASLFDGHDAAINIMRRIIQSTGVEVIHLGHNRSAQEIVDCAIQEDVQAIAITSYQGGHVEFLNTYMTCFKSEVLGMSKFLVEEGGPFFRGDYPSPRLWHHPHLFPGRWTCHGTSGYDQSPGGGL